MDAQTRAALSAKLSDLRQRGKTLSTEIKRHYSERQGKGNAFFYSALPVSDPKGKDNFTGHSEQNLDAMLELLRVSRDVKDIERQIGHTD